MSNTQDYAVACEFMQRINGLNYLLSLGRSLAGWVINITFLGQSGPRSKRTAKPRLLDAGHSGCPVCLELVELNGLRAEHTAEK